MSKLIRLLLMAMMFTAIGVFNADAAQPKKCEIVHSEVTSYSIPPSPYPAGKVYIKSIKVDVTIKHKSGEKTVMPTEYVGSVDTAGGETLADIIAKGKKEAVDGIQLLISSGGCPGGDGDPLP